MSRLEAVQASPLCARTGSIVTRGRSITSGDIAGTFAYAAPELLLNEPCDSSADLYSFGVLLWEIVTRRNPARGRLLPPQVPDECPAEIVDLIQVPI